jgi:hypothetical protein
MTNNNNLTIIELCCKQLNIVDPSINNLHLSTLDNCQPYHNIIEIQTTLTSFTF